MVLKITSYFTLYWQSPNILFHDVGDDSTHLHTQLSEYAFRASPNIFCHGRSDNSLFKNVYVGSTTYFSCSTEHIEEDESDDHEEEDEDDEDLEEDEAADEAADEDS